MFEMRSLTRLFNYSQKKKKKEKEEEKVNYFSMLGISTARLQ
jgi:hypothetical protein